MTDPLSQEFSDGFSDFAEQQQSGRWAGDKNLMVKFHTVPMMDAQASREEGRPIYRDVEHIRILSPGDRGSFDKPVTDLERRRFKDLYERWKANEEVDLTGTPLESCTWIARSFVEEMKYFNIRTVEQLANLSDTHSQKFPGISRFKDLAKSYLAQAEKGKAASELAAAMEKKDQQIADLTEMVKGLQETLAQLQASIAPAPSPAPKTKGRPRAQ